MPSNLGQQWLDASNDLGVRVTAPFALTLKSGESVLYDVAVHDFGAERGMILIEEWDESKARVAQELGYGYACLEASHYDRESTIDVLRDWGWSSQEVAPPWL